jgi:hypothetical protein
MSRAASFAFLAALLTKAVHAACKAGSFINSAGACAPCPKGKYQLLTDQTFCLQWNIQPKTASAVTPDKTIECARGEYSQIASGFNSCTRCPPGKYAPRRGRCYACPYSYFQQDQGQLRCTTCTGGVAADHQTLCKPTAPTVKIDCNIGSQKTAKMEPKALQINSGSSQRCSLCPAGSFGMPDPTGVAICQRCPTGKYQHATGQSSCAVCASPLCNAHADSSCKRGHWQGKGADRKTPYCYMCPGGKYQPEAGKTSCRNCPIGMAAKVWGRAECKACAAGWASEGMGQQSCSRCSSGRHQPLRAQGSCAHCSSNRQRFVSESGIACFGSCPPMTYARLTTRGGECMRCPTGRYSKRYNSTSCEAQPVGSSRFAHFCPIGSSASKNSYGRFLCRMCPPGKYQPRRGQPSCRMCPAAKFISYSGSSCCYAFGESLDHPCIQRPTVYPTVPTMPHMPTMSTMSPSTGPTAVHVVPTPMPVVAASELASAVGAKRSPFHFHLLQSFHTSGTPGPGASTTPAAAASASIPAGKGNPTVSAASAGLTDDIASAFAYFKQKKPTPSPPLPTPLTASVASAAAALTAAGSADSFPHV